MQVTTLLTYATFVNLAIAGYVLQDDYMKDFFDNFEFFTEQDPTNGFVKFVDHNTAQSSGLINSTTGGAVSWGVDSTNQAPDGRASVRIASKKSYNNGLMVLDVAHMPEGCGTWPAFWMVGPSWPINGEIDILEGVNDQATNAMTLHTGPGCSISSSNLGFDGSIQTSNCDVNAVNQDKNAGCSIKSSHKSSYGAGLNAAQGGVYATELTDDAISIYFFTRSQIPSDLASENPDPSTWGTPAAKFSGGCDIASTFNKLQFVFDTTFCGDWAGNAWPGSSCASSTKTSTCKAYVANNPQAFKNAYWTVNSLRVYQNKGDAVPSPSYSASGPSRSVAPPASIPSSSKILTNTPSATAVPTSTGGRYHHHTRYSFSKSQASDSPIPTPSPSDFAHSSAPVSAPVSTDSLLISSNIVPTPSSPTGSPGGVKKGGMATAFQWPKAKQRSGSPAAPEPTQNKENKAPTTMTTITAPPAPVATNEKGQVVKTLVETIYVTVAPSAAGSRRAKQVRRHMVQENARR